MSGAEFATTGRQHRRPLPNVTGTWPGWKERGIEWRELWLSRRLGPIKMGCPFVWGGVGMDVELKSQVLYYNCVGMSMRVWFIDRIECRVVKRFNIFSVWIFSPFWHSPVFFEAPGHSLEILHMKHAGEARASYLFYIYMYDRTCSNRFSCMLYKNVAPRDKVSTNIFTFWPLFFFPKLFYILYKLQFQVVMYASNTPPCYIYVSCI